MSVRPLNYFCAPPPNQSSGLHLVTHTVHADVNKSTVLSSAER